MTKPRIPAEYELIAQGDQWSVLSGDGKRFAWSRYCEWLQLSALRRPARKAAGGLRFRIETPQWLYADDRAFIDEVIEGGGARLQLVLERLGVLEHLRHPETFVDAELVWDRHLRRDLSSNSVSALARYDRFVPDELRPHLPRTALK